MKTFKLIVLALAFLSLPAFSEEQISIEKSISGKLYSGLEYGSDYNGFSVGFNKEFGFGNGNSLIYGFRYDNLRLSNNHIYANDLKQNHYKEFRENFMFTTGIKTTYKRFFAVGYFGFGLSKGDSYNFKGSRQYSCTVAADTGCHYKGTSEINKIDDSALNVGIRVGYQFGDRDIAPYLDARMITYQFDSHSNKSVNLGVAFGF